MLNYVKESLTEFRARQYLSLLRIIIMVILKLKNSIRKFNQYFFKENNHFALRNAKYYGDKLIQILWFYLDD